MRWHEDESAFQVLPCMDIKRGASSFRIVQQERQGALPENPLQPLQQALRFREQGARYLHVVDIDGATGGRPGNSDVIRTMVAETDLRVEVGGGVRTMADIEAYLTAGVWQVLLNTKALDLEFIQRCVAEFGAGSLTIALDLSGERFISDGWSVVHDLPAARLGVDLASLGIRRFVTTDLERDGSLEGPAIDKCLALRSAIGGHWVVSGGISRLEHVAQLVHLGFSGAVIGRALYAGTLDLAAILAIAAGDDRSHA